MNLAELIDQMGELPRSAPELVAAALREAIRRGILKPGASLGQGELATQFKVSHIPVREAIRKLEAEGLVVVHPNRGAFVAQLSLAEVQEVFDIRIPLELTALKLSIPNMTEIHLQQAKTVLDTLEHSPQTGDWFQLDTEFHLGLYADSQRPRLLNLIATMRAHYDRYRHMLVLRTGMASAQNREDLEHQLLYQACMERDIPKALEVLEKHLLQASQIILEQLSRAGIR
jgi:DNA-binding GntR family transcriptional regulator